MELHPRSAIKHKQETTDWILLKEEEGYDDKAKNGRDNGNYGCMEPNWEIKFGDIMDEEWGVKLSLEEESNNSMKTDEEGLIEDRVKCR